LERGDGGSQQLTRVPECAPYDAILVAVEAPAPPGSLMAQLADGGRLIIPVNGGSHQDLKVITRHGDVFEEENLGAVRFVPLLDKEGCAEK
jgi:protein-L-isoaspartate(D-aspartate) O-methyltransferase